MIEKNIILNVENTLYDPAKKKAKEQGIVLKNIYGDWSRKIWKGRKLFLKRELRKLLIYISMKNLNVLNVVNQVVMMERFTIRN